MVPTYLPIYTKSYLPIYTKSYYRFCIKSGGRRYYSTVRHKINTYGHKDEKNLNIEELKSLHQIYINDLYKNRNAIVKPFEDKVLATCNDINNKCLKLKHKSDINNKSFNKFKYESNINNKFIILINYYNNYKLFNIYKNKVL